MRTTLTARELLLADRTIPFPVVTVEDGLIAAIESGEPTGDTTTLTPAFFDIHVHGAMGQDFMAADAAGIDTVGRFLATRGVGHYLATTVTGRLDTTLHALGRIARAIGTGSAADAATPVGIHLEGPFLCAAKRGVHPADLLLPPSIETFDRFQQAAEGNIRLITVAPELPGALDLIRHATAQGVRCSLGHSNATYAEAAAGIAAGATGATHTFNAMRAAEQREPGLTGAVLDRPELFAELICDGVHVHPAMVRLWFRSKGADRAILVTDGMSATGMPEGNYLLGAFAVEVRNGVCRNTEGALAGSVLTMDRAVENFTGFTGEPLAAALHLAAHNPAALLGLQPLTALAPGQPAHLNRFTADGRHSAAIRNGHPLPR